MPTLELAVTINSHWCPNDDLQKTMLNEMSVYLLEKSESALLVLEGLPQSLVGEVGGPCWHWQGIIRIVEKGKEPLETFRKQILRDHPCLKGTSNNKRYSLAKIRTSWDIAGRYCTKTMKEGDVAQWIEQDRLKLKAIEDEWLRNTISHREQIKSITETSKGSKLSRYLELCQGVPNTCDGITSCIMHDAIKHKHLLPPIRALATYVNTIRLIRADKEGAEYMIRNTALEIKMILDYTGDGL